MVFRLIITNQRSLLNFPIQCTTYKNSKGSIETFTIILWSGPSIKDVGIWSKGGCQTFLKINELETVCINMISMNFEWLNYYSTKSSQKLIFFFISESNGILIHATYYKEDLPSY